MDSLRFKGRSQAVKRQLPDSPLSLGQPLQSVLLRFRRLLDLGLQLLLLADDLLLLQSDLLRALHHLDLHLLLLDALLGFGHLVTKPRRRWGGWGK